MIRVESRRFGLATPALLLAFACAAAAGWLLSAQEPAPAPAALDVVEVEEDWELVVAEPNALQASPQVATQMFPQSGVTDTFAVFAINYQELPTFVEGGVEIQYWEGDWNVDVKSVDRQQLSTNEETLAWTQYMKVVQGKIVFGLKDFDTASFGHISGNRFRVVSQSDATDLNGYSVEKSALNSGVPLGANRVRTFKLKESRKKMSDGSVVTDSTPRVVYERVEANPTP
ncbi:MAG TPA: hypothetical protein VNC50_05735 [Planctomycetia bacterium]|nr:hypothetical protein [Planctomycetia bacterium]